MDSLITAAARALAAGDPLGALNRVALRDDAPALALRGIAMAQLGDLVRAKALVRSAARASPIVRPWRSNRTPQDGAGWNALISKYIGTIPVSGDASCAAEQSISGGPPPRTPVSSAMIAKLGAVARDSQSAAPKAAALSLPAQAPAVSRWVAIIVADPRLSSNIFFVPVERGDVEMSSAAPTSRVW